MKRTLNTIIGTAVLACALVTTSTAQAEDLEAAAKESIQNFKQADASLGKLFKSAAGYVILPSVGEGGFIIGGEHGDGLVYEGGKVTGKVTMSEVSVGAQVGGGKFAEVIFFENKDAMAKFKSTKYEMNAGAKATIAASGSGENAKYDQGISVFTLPSGGAMVAATVGGQKFEFKPLK